MVLSIEEIKHKYNEFNTIFFCGLLPRVSEIVFFYDTEIKDAVGYTFINHIDGCVYNMDKFNECYKYAIAFNPDVCITEQDIYDTLCHEMIHLYQFYLDFDKYAGPNTWTLQHGRVFVQKMNFINREAERLKIKLKLDVVKK